MAPHAIGSIALAVAAAVTLGPRPAGAVDPARAGASPRALNGHVFQPSRLVQGPFATTTVGMATVFGAGEAEAPRYNLAGERIGTRTYRLGVYGQQIGLGLRVTPDVALRLVVDGFVFSGTNGRSLLAAGASAQFGGAFGITAGRDLGRTVRLAFVGDVGVAPEVSVLIADTVLRAIASRVFESGDLLTTASRLTVAPGLSLAWAPAAAVGLVAEARYLWSRRVSSDDAELVRAGLVVGATAGLDLDPLLRLPLGVQAVYRGQLPPGDLPDVHETGLGFYYTRRAALALGVELAWRHGVVRPDVRPRLDVDSATAALRLQYYW